MESRHLFVVVAGGNSVLDRNRAVLESNFVLGVVAGCRLEGEDCTAYVQIMVPFVIIIRSL